jgi:hypothetical protein
MTTTITLSYDTQNSIAQKTLEYILSLGVFQEKKKKTSFERAMEDIEKGRVHRLITPE